MKNINYIIIILRLVSVALLISISGAAFSQVPCSKCPEEDYNLTFQCAGGTAPFTYSWSTSETTSVITVAGPGTYTVTCTDANGCESDTTFILTDFSAPTASCAGTNPICNGDSNGEVTVTSSGNSPFTFDIGSSSNSTGTFTGLSSGSYTVTVTDVNGCTNTCSATLTDPPVLNLSCNSDPADCGQSNGTVIASASGGVTPYTYNLGAAINNSGVFPGLAGGSYVVTVTDISGCSNTCSVTVNEVGGISANCTSTNITCNGDSDGAATATPTSGTAPYTYAWSNSGTTQTITGLGVGTYTVTVTDVDGCTAVCGTSITQPTALSVNCTGTNSTCGNNDGTATGTPSGGTSGYTYLWDDPASQTTQTATGLAAGTYTVTVTDANGCTATCSSLIQDTAAPSVTAVCDAVTCNGDSDGSAEAFPLNGGGPPWTYAWSNSATTKVINGLTAGTYTVTVTDSNGCTASASCTVTEPAAITTTVSCN